MLETVSDNVLDFVYGYLIVQSYFFKIKTNVEEESYPNEDYAERWRRYLSNVDYSVMLKKAFELISDPPPSDTLNVFDCLVRSSYFGLVHREHPNITLGFVKDADLWDIWLNEGIYRIARERIAELSGLGAGDRVLDLGCGSISPLFYADVVGANGFYTGVDASKPLINLAKMRVRERGLAWVDLRLEDVNSRLGFRRCYDVVICSSILQYANVRNVLTNALNALSDGGRIVIFSEVFADLEPEKAELFTLYYELIPEFRRFPTLSEIVNHLTTACEFKYRTYGRNYVVIDVMDVFNG